MANRSTLRLYIPHEGQRQIHRSQTRFNAVCFGRQSGKTTYGLNKIADRAWRGPGDGVYWYVLQTYDAASVAFRRMMQFYFNAPQAFAKKPNESDLTCQFYHGPMIAFKSGKNYQDLRVETLDGTVIDEYRQQNRELWPMIIRPMLAKKGGWADILSTSNGFEHFYDIFENAKTDKEWSTFHAPSTVAPWWTPEEIASAKATMSEAEFKQEIMAEFCELTQGTVYTSHGSWNEAYQNPFAIQGQLWTPHLPIVVGMDFNVGLMCWELSQFRGRCAYFGDEIAMPWSGFGEAPSTAAAKILVEKVRGHPAGIVIVGDASGKSRHSNASDSDYGLILDVLRAAGIKVSNKTPEQNPHVKDRINLMNAAMRSASGDVNLWYHPTRCPRLKKDFQRVKWKIGRSGDGEIDKSDPDLTHPSDAAGYPVYHYTQLLRSRPGRMTVIRSS